MTTLPAQNMREAISLFFQRLMQHAGVVAPRGGRGVVRVIKLLRSFLFYNAMGGGGVLMGGIDEKGGVLMN